MVSFGAGLTSGFVSCVLLQPLDLIKTRLQVHGIAGRSEGYEAHSLLLLSSLTLSAI